MRARECRERGGLARVWSRSCLELIKISYKCMPCCLCVKGAHKSSAFIVERRITHWSIGSSRGGRHGTAPYGAVANRCTNVHQPWHILRVKYHSGRIAPAVIVSCKSLWPTIAGRPDMILTAACLTYHITTPALVGIAAGAVNSRQARLAATRNALRNINVSSINVNVLGRKFWSEGVFQSQKSLPVWGHAIKSKC